MKRLLTCLAFLSAAPAFSQGFEVTALAGYTTAGGLQHDTRTVEDLKLAGGFTWGASLGFFFSERLGVEASWARVRSGVELSTAEASQEIFDVTIDQIQGSLVYQLGAATSRFRPFLTAGAGAAIFTSTDINTEAKLSLGIGAGLKWLPSKRLGARLQARYTPTYLHDKGSHFCDPFGFCQNWLHQFELTRGRGVSPLTA
jgi:opacity protein-like surface antigen